MKLSIINKTPISYNRDINISVCCSLEVTKRALKFKGNLKLNYKILKIIKIILKIIFIVTLIFNKIHLHLFHTQLIEQ